MRDLLNLAWNALTFQHDAYVEHVRRDDVLKRAILLLVLVTLVAGSISFLISFVNGLRPVNIAEERLEFEESFRDFLDQYGELLDIRQQDVEEIFSYIRPNMEIGWRIAALPTPLPRVVGNILTSIGQFLSLPFSRLGGWLAYTLWVMLAAKLLGGKGTVAQMLGATALYIVPHVLGIFGFIDCLGGILGFVATLWGIAIYIKGLAVACDFGIGKATLAALLPGVIAGFITLILAAVPLISLISALASS
jgi:hypothetical protein